MMYIAGYVVIGIAIAFMLVGVVGIFQPRKDFYYRILVACKIDTVGMLTFAIGMALRHGFSFFTGKMFLIVIIMMVLNPLVAHVVAGCAYKSGYMSTSSESANKEISRPSSLREKGRQSGIAAENGYTSTGEDDAQ